MVQPNVARNLFLRVVQDPVGDLVVHVEATTRTLKQSEQINLSKKRRVKCPIKFFSLVYKLHGFFVKQRRTEGIVDSGIYE